MNSNPYQEEAELEIAAWQRIEYAAQALADAVGAYPHIWGWGDGNGGCVLDKLELGLNEYGLSRFPPKGPLTAKAISTKDRWAVYDRDGYCCVACGSNEKLTVDHVVPRRKGGTNDLDNLQTLCGSCNTSKGTKTMDEWLATQR